LGAGDWKIVPADLTATTGTGESSPKIHYIHADHLGTPRAITRSTDNAKVWEWDSTEAFGNNLPNENPSALGVFTYNLRMPGQQFDKETGTFYNYFRDYDPAIGRYGQSDPIGLVAGMGTYSYVSGMPLRKTDRFGLTEADVQGVWRDTLANFADLKPSSNRIKFRPMRPDGDQLGETSNHNGQIYVDPSWSRIACFTKSEYENLFYILFHESMHSTDSLFTRSFLTTNEDDNPHHNRIYRRESFERYRIPRTPMPSADQVWGTPRQTPLDDDRNYQSYRKRTPACCESK
jgi:RHS repeat-associated protein